MLYVISIYIFQMRTVNLVIVVVFLCKNGHLFDMINTMEHGAIQNNVLVLQIAWI